MELHDSLGQQLLVIKNQALLGTLDDRDGRSPRKRLDEILESTTQSLDEVRQIAYNLRPYHLDRLGLTNSIEDMIERVASSSRIQFLTDIAPIDGTIPKSMEINLYRVVQESVNNIVKHSGSTHASIRIERSDHRVTVTVHDDGKGFDLEGRIERRSILARSWNGWAGGARSNAGRHAYNHVEPRPRNDDRDTGSGRRSQGGVVSVNTPVTIVIADDHPIFRKGLKEVIESDPSLKVAGEAADGTAALEAIARLAPDLAILDVNMPGLDGCEVTKAIRDRRLPTQVIVLTMHRDERFLNSALDAGVMGYVLKDGAATEIVTTIKAVRAGQHYISPALSSYLVSRTRRMEKLAGAAPGIEALTPAERNVLKLLAEFKTTKEIADILCVSPRTVDHHRANIATKLDLRGSHALTRFAVEHRSVISE